MSVIGSNFGSFVVPSKSDSPRSESKTWILWSLASALSFTIDNALISDITANVGPLYLFYMCTGNALASATYLITSSCKNKKENGTFWLNQNIVIDGKIKPSHLLGFLTYCLIYFMC